MHSGLRLALTLPSFGCARPRTHPSFARRFVTLLRGGPFPVSRRSHSRAGAMSGKGGAAAATPAPAAAKFSSLVSDRVLREASGGTDAWAKIIEWSKGEGMLNLGQGFPDFVPAATLATLKAGVAEALDDNALNQYSPQTGLPTLRSAVADLFRVFYGRAVDPASEVVVLPSGTSGIFATVQAFCNPGDEVVIFEPFFPWYEPTVRLAGAVPRVVRLEAPGFRIERAAVEAAFSDRTKLCIVNSPHNPTGRVFDASELAVVADLCQRHDAVCLSDEVYEGCVYPLQAGSDGGGGGGGGGGHRSISDMAGMQERTLTLHSASKLLGVTGWRVGWVVGPAPMISAVTTAHSYMTFCAPTPLQHAVARAVGRTTKEAEAAAAAAGSADGGEPATGLPILDCGATAEFHANSVALAAAVRATGIDPLPCAAGYFLLADVSKAGVTGHEYCEWLAKEVKLVAVPLALFYDSHDASSLVRFCVCKKPEYMQLCIDRLLTKRHPGLSAATSER